MWFTDKAHHILMAADWVFTSIFSAAGWHLLCETLSTTTYTLNGVMSTLGVLTLKDFLALHSNIIWINKSMFIFHRLINQLDANDAPDKVEVNAVAVHCSLENSDITEAVNSVGNINTFEQSWA